MDAIVESQLAAAINDITRLQNAINSGDTDAALAIGAKALERLVTCERRIIQLEGIRRTQARKGIR